MADHAVSGLRLPLAIVIHAGLLLAVLLHAVLPHPRTRRGRVTPKSVRRTHAPSRTVLSGGDN